MDSKHKEEIAQLHARFCSGLSDQSRMMIVYVLTEGPHSVSEIVEELDMPQSFVSRHLKILRERGIVDADRQGRSVIYSLADDRIVGALNTLQAIISDQIRARADLIDHRD